MATLETETSSQEDNSSQAFVSFVKQLESRTGKFQSFLQELEDDQVSPRNNKEKVNELSKSMEDFEIKKIKFLKEIEEEEQSDKSYLEQLATDKEAAGDWAPVPSLLTFTNDDDDPLLWNVDDFGVLTAKATRLAYQDLAALIEDQEQKDVQWSSRQTESKKQSLSGKLQCATLDNRIFFEKRTKPPAQNEKPTLDESLNDEDMKTVISDIDEEAERLRAEYEMLSKQARESNEQTRTKAAIIIQTCYRGYRVRRIHGAKVNKLIIQAKKHLFDERVKTIEAERQRLLELKRAEEATRKAELDKKRKAEEAKKKAELEEKRQAELEAKKQAELEAKKQAELKAKKQAELEAKQKAEEEAKRLAELEAQREAKELEKRKMEEELERKQKEEAEKARQEAEAERQEKLRLDLEKKKKREEAEKVRLEREKLEEERLKEEAEQQRILQLSFEAEKFSKSETIISEDTYVREKSGSAQTKRFPRIKTATRVESPTVQEIGRDLTQIEIVNTEEDTDVTIQTEEPVVKMPKPPRFEIDYQHLKSRQMTWVKSCRSWSETVAQLRVNSGKVRQTPNSSSKNRLCPPPDCKLIPTGDLLMRTFGRTHPAPASITSLAMANLRSQFDLSALSSLVNLLCLDISRSNFTVLCNLDACSRLAYLNASNNKIKDVDVNKLRELSFLDISYNQLTSLAGLSGCTNLSHLNASYNRLVRVNLSLTPSTCFGCLHSVDVSHNQLLGTRDWLADMPSLVSLDVSSNNLRAVDCIANLGVLQFINASYNSLSEIPDFSNSPLLVDVNLSGNNLHSIDSLSNFFLPHLVRLDVSRNMLTSIPDISNLFNLIEARLENNQIITYDALLKSSSIAKLAKLKFLRGDFLCFSSDDATLINEELRNGRGVEMISAEYDDAIALCSTLKLLISPGLIEDEEDENERATAKDDYLEFARFVILLQDNVNNELSALTGDSIAGHVRNPDSNKQKAAAASISNQFVETRWKILKEYFEDSSKAAVERRYAIEFCGIDSGSFSKTLPDINSMQQEPPPKMELRDEMKPVRNTDEKTQRSEKRRQQKKQKDVELAEEKRRNAAALRIQCGWRGFLARYEVARWQVAATIIQKTWRGFWVRKQIQSVLEQFAHEHDEANNTGNEVEEEVDEEFNDKSVDDLLSFVSGIESVTESINWMSSRPGSRAFDKDSSHKIAWNTPTPKASHNFGEDNEKEDNLTPLAEASSSAVPPVHLDALESPSSKKAQNIQEEWGFGDPHTAVLMMKRANRMKQGEKRQKLAKLDAQQRLAMARKHGVMESYRVPLSSHAHHVVDTSRKQYPVHEVQMGATAAQTGRSMSPSEASFALGSVRQNQTFAWVHSVVREPSPMMQSGNGAGGFPPISAGGLMSNYTSGLASNRPAGFNDQRRRSGDAIPTFPPLNSSPKPSSASTATTIQPQRSHPSKNEIPKQITGSEPKKRDLIRAWREPAVRLSGGWGGGRAAHRGKKK